MPDTRDPDTFTYTWETCRAMHVRLVDGNLKPSRCTTDGVAEFMGVLLCQMDVDRAKGLATLPIRVCEQGEIEFQGWRLPE